MFQFVSGEVDQCEVDGVNEGSTQLFPCVHNKWVTKFVFLLKTDLLQNGSDANYYNFNCNLAEIIRKGCEFDHIQIFAEHIIFRTTVVTESPTLSNKIRKPLCQLLL